MKRLLLIDNSIGDHYNAIGQMTFFPIPFDTVNLYAGDPVPSLEGYTHLIATGCVKSVLDKEPWMVSLRALLQEALRRDICLLCVCFSHQLLGQVVGGDACARRRAAPELGWYAQTLLCDDPLLGKKGDVLYGLMSHYDEVTPDLPAGKATILLRSDTCEVEAFRVLGKNAWGLQGHFEETIESGQALLAYDRAHRPETVPYIQTDLMSKDSGLWPTLIQRFCALEPRPVSQVMMDMIDYSQGDLHDIDHFLKVYAYAKTIAEQEGVTPFQQQTVELAAILHDIACPLCREKYGNTNGKHQEAEGPALAAPLLQGLPVEVADRVLFLIGHHHTPDTVDGIDYQILLEADYLVNAGESGWSQANIQNARTKLFKTSAGLALLQSIYSL